MAAAHPSRDDLSAEQRSQLDWWLGEFDHSWDDGRLAAFVAQLPANHPFRLPALLGLVRLDLRHQWRHGRRRTVESYLESYPELGTPDTAPAELVAAEYEARQAAGAPADWSEFAHRFPRQTTQLRPSSPPPLPQSPTLTAPPSRATARPRGEQRPSQETRAGGSSVPSSGDPPRPSGDLPEEFGRYRIERRLGHGGMGAVYLAWDSQLDRHVALKVPHFRADDNPRALQRFYTEARAAATLHHPNLCPVYDVGERNGVPYLTMAYIEGKPLSAVIAGSRPPTPTQAAAVVRKLALALHEAHAKGIIHRDLKPSNVMINPRGEPVVMDFGLARRASQGDVRLTQEGSVMGTPAYMSPEQVNGDVEHMGPGCDIYSLGVILYELLTGKLPYDGPPTLVLALILTQAPVPPSQRRPGLDPKLEAICLKAMARRVEDRHPTMAAFAAALAEYLRGSSRTSAAEALGGSPADGTLTQEPFRPSSATLLAEQPRGRRPPAWFWAAAGVAVVSLLVLLGTVLYVATDNGTIKIELTGDAAAAEVKVDGGTVTVTGLGEPLRLRAGEHHLVVSGENFETVSKSFTVKRGGNPVLRVELVPKQVAQDKPAEPPPEDPAKQLTLLPLADLAIKPGESKVIDVRVQRNGYRGPIKLLLEGLPERVAMKPAEIPPGQDAGRVEVIAAANAEVSAVRATVVATAGPRTIPGPVNVRVEKAIAAVPPPPVAPAPAPRRSPLPSARLIADRSWGPEQATGPPDTYPSAGDYTTAWASRTSDGQDEWLLLEFPKAVVPASLKVYETFNPGALSRVTVVAADGTETEVWKSADPTPVGRESGISEIPLNKVDFPVRHVKLYLDSQRVSGWNEIDAVGLVDGAGKIAWASAAAASSTYASYTDEPQTFYGKQTTAKRRLNRSWGPEQATGAPDAWPQSGDLTSAWASRTPDDKMEWLQLDYDEPVVPAAVHIYETYNPGAVYAVAVFDPDGKEVTAWRGRDPTPPGSEKGISKISIAVGFKVSRVKIYVNSPAVAGWNEIDAVGLVDKDGQTQWATEATASSTYAD